MSLLTHSRLYLQRLGYDSPPAPSLRTLQDLQLRHVCSFAFENLSSLMRLPVPIDLASVEQKVLLEGRGGYCYELNQMFLAGVAGRGFGGVSFTHLTLPTKRQARVDRGVRRMLGLKRT
nr:arylamine N-acetyltransferase [Pseudomonas simiae]